MVWDRLEFNVSQHFLSALINGDETGLTDKESKLLDWFEQYAIKTATKNYNATTWHWTVPEQDDPSPSFMRCDVCDLMADCQPLWLMFQYDEKENAR